MRRQGEASLDDKCFSSREGLQGENLCCLRWKKENKLKMIYSVGFGGSFVIQSNVSFI